MKTILLLGLIAPLFAQNFVEPPGVYRYGFELVDHAPGYQITVKNYLDDLDPKLKPALPEQTPEIRMSAARGEYEPATFVIYATRNLGSVDVEAGDLKNGSSVIPAGDIEVRRVVRTPVRRVYTAPVGTADVVGRFLPRWQPASIPAGEFREVWLTVHVPAKASAGDYRGQVTVHAGNNTQSVPVTLHVHSFDLKENPQKCLGIYYRPNDEARTRRELKDLYEHGVRNLVMNAARINYVRDGKSFAPDYTDLKKYLSLVRQAGFHGTVVIGTGFMNLAQRLGHKDVSSRKDGTGTGESLDGPGGEEFRRVARVSMEGVKKVQAEFPELRLVMTEMDEVFGQNRLPLYIRLTKAGQQVPGLKFYITFHTRDEQADQMRKEIDPYVDIRCHHGYTFEWWLARGHTIAEMKAELAASGDEAWFYHNVRGSFFLAKWSRIINGFYLWASPFTTHAPWIYQSYHGNPFDDADDKGVDFGMSFPGPVDAADLVPTRIWECMREGYDDLRYVATLQEAIRTQGASKSRQAAAAQAFLDKVDGLFDIRTALKTLPDLKPVAARPGDQIDLDTGLPVRKTVGTSEEAPLINALAQRFTGEQWEAMRQEIVRHILSLTGR